MLARTRPSESNALSTASLTTVVDNLHRQNLLTEAAYREVRRLTEGGDIQERSCLLHYVTVDSINRWLELDELNSSSCVPSRTTIIATFTGEVSVEELQQSLQRLNNAGVLSPPVYQQLQEELAAGRIRLDVDLFQQAETRMQQYERLQPEAIAPYLQ
jgi:ribosomal protein L19E